MHQNAERGAGFEPPHNGSLSAENAHPHHSNRSPASRPPHVRIAVLFQGHGVEPSDAAPEQSDVLRHWLASATRLRTRLLHFSKLDSLLRRLSRGDIDVVLLDIADIAGPNGTATVHAVQTVRERAPGLPVIVLVRAAHEGSAHRAIEAGADDSLIKEHMHPEALERSILYAIELKRRDRALYIAQSRFRGLFEQSPFAIHRYRPDGQTLEVNRPWADLYGMSIESALAYNLLQDAGLQKSGAADWVRRAFAGEVIDLPAVRTKRMLPQGTGEEERWVRAFAYPVRDETGQVCEVVFVVEDITERKKAEEALRSSEHRYAELVNSLDSIVWEGDAETFRFTFVSEQAERLLGYPVQRWISEPTFWRDHMHPEDREWVPEYCALATAEKRPHEFVYRMIAADGRIVWLHDIVTVQVEDDRPVKLRGVMVDITKRQLAEAGLKSAEEQYRAIFEATSDGLVINDLDGNVVEVNPAFCKMHGYTYEEMLRVPPRDFIHPDYHYLFEEYVQVTRAGGTYQCQAMDVRKDGTPFHVEVHGGQFMFNGKPHVLGVVRDISERMQAYELLEQRVEERTRELSTLLEVSQNVTSTLELRPLLSRISEQLKVIAHYSGSTIIMADGDDLVVMDSWGAIAQEPAILGQRFPKTNMGIIWDELSRGQAVIIEDVHGQGPYALAYRTMVGGLLHTALSYMHSWLAVPLKLKDRIIGLMSLSHSEVGYYTERHARLAMAIANHAALAVENARLYEQAQTTARMTSALAQIASRVAFGGSLQSTLDDLCEQVVGATGAVGAAVALFEGASRQARMVGTYGLPEGYASAMNSVYASEAATLTQLSFSERKPLVYSGMRDFVLSRPEYSHIHDFMKQVTWDTVVAVPMVYRDELMGVLLSYHQPTQNIGDAELAFHTAIADQAAVAVQNALLLTQVQDKAALEERARLARELHDSVSQALFSMGLIARSIELTLAREGAPSQAVMQHVADLRSLTQAALADMRALIFELRPGALEEEGLLNALRKHAAGVQGRQMLQVSVVCPNEQEAGDGVLPRLKPAAEEALYRIAQEALHNVVKHAKAGHVEICIEADDRFVTLQIKDDGVGFDVGNVPAGHMGLGTMRQRAQSLSAEYRVESIPGQGTTVSVRVPLAEWMA